MSVLRASVLVVVVSVVYMLWAHQPQLNSPSSRKLSVLYCGGGEYFNFFEPALKAAASAALAPVIPNLTFSTLETEVTPDLVIFSIWGDCHARYPVVPKILVVAEPEYNNQLSFFANLTLHCARQQGTTYFPWWVASFGERRQHSPKDLLKDASKVASAMKSKSHFCAFLYSYSAPDRDRLYDILSTFGRVDALGVARSGKPREATDRGVNTDFVTFNDLAVQKYAPYKFVICGENTRLEGYTTEKIVSAMLAYAIPIYIGASDISTHFNPRSFINANEMSREELIDTVRALDSNDTAYSVMLNEPWFVGNALPAWFDVRQQQKLFQESLFRSTVLST
jgi:hypothetical protein